MNKQLPEDIMSKIDMEAAQYSDYLIADDPIEAFDSEDEYKWRQARKQEIKNHYIAGRTASVQPLIECFDLIKAYCENDGYNTAWILLKINEALSSFPSSPNNTGDWIRVKDRLPEKSGLVLIFLETDSVYVSYYRKEKNLFEVWGAGRDPITDMRTSHWQPLPEPPKQ